MAGFAAAVVVAARPTSALAQDGDAEMLMVVDCLLPGQVRSLGQSRTYLSARRPARLPARDCQIRGGEFVAYDRADVRSALAAWLPLAEQGDVEARAVVGEIFERGLGVSPDHTAAAKWYRLAAEAGNRRAQVNLGHLYETGLGVERDPRIALEWYRRAAGSEATYDIDTGPLQADSPALASSTAPQSPGESTSARTAEEQLQLREREKALEGSLAALRAELDSTREALDASLVRITAAERDVSVAQSEAREATAKAEAARAEAARIAAIAPSPDRSLEVTALQQELERRTREAQAMTIALQAAREANEAYVRSLNRQAGENTNLGTHVDAQRKQLEQVGRQLEQSEAELVRQTADLARLNRELGEATALVKRQQGEIERLQASAQQRLLAGPELALVEPELMRTRDIVPVATAATNERRIVGRVIAPAGIEAVTVNDRSVVPNELGVFSLALPASPEGSTVNIVAVDRQGKRSEMKFVLRQEAMLEQGSESALRSQGPAVPAVDFGNYHALIIGNNDYQLLPDLASPLNDVSELAALLRERYGFQTTVLTNANRYQILSALNRLRESLTSRDNLLIYYAGHGELDEVNQRGHWLPVDAERDSTANWIPTTAITDLLNIISAKQVMLVVDSCYAGALTRSSVGRLRTGMTPEEQLHWYRTMSSRKSRTVLTSGGVSPVLDAGGGRHSIFAKALLEVLAANSEILDGQRLHRDVAARVAFAAANLRFDQVPEYAPIRFAGHEAGEFFLVPRK